VRSIWIAPAFSGALTGLARKNNATQAKAWAKFPRPFGPKRAAADSQINADSDTIRREPNGGNGLREG